MSFKKVTAIFDQLKLVDVENALSKNSHIGFTVHSVEGKGAYVNLYSKNALSSHIQMDIYTHNLSAHKVAKIIMQAACTHSEDEGLISITDIDELFWIHTQKAVSEDELLIE
tara:strand:- start:4112 stop:4447 length:336 start_codon:yes stop_codon:yes gene_type:complete